MDETIDVAVFSRHPNATTGSDHVFYVGAHRLGGSKELTVMVDERPSYVGVDPFLRRIDRNLVDNVSKVDAADL